MQIRVLLVFVLAGVVLAVVLYVVGMSRRAKRKSVPQGQNELRQDEAQPTVECEPSVQTQVSERVQPEPEVPSVKVESELTDALEVARALEGRPGPIAEVGPTVTKTEKSREVEVHEAMTEAHTETLEEVGECPKPTPTTEDPSVTTIEPTGDMAKEDSPERGSSAVSPEKRGGRPRTGGKESEEVQRAKGRSRTPKPEIVCWKREREWVLAVEIPEGLRTMSISQNDIRLTDDALKNGCWRLARLGGEVVVSTLENERQCQSRNILGDDNHLVFKLSGVDQNQGRRVRRPTYGSFLVVVPEDWNRDEELAGPPPAKPEPVCLEAYRAHFFSLKQDNRMIAFRDSTGRSVVIGSSELRFQVVGRELYDAAENSGPLFGGSPPRIRVADGSWQDVGTIVVGTEGSGRERCRIAFVPNPVTAEQDMPADIACRKAGWYFVRFYDLQDELMDSLDFRFGAGLQRITIQQGNPLPPATGHGVVTIEFQHDADWHVRSHLTAPAQIKIERIDGKTTLTIPPMRECDRSRWLLGPSNGPHVEVAILAERVWWAMSNVNAPPYTWQDTSLPLSPEDFTPTSEQAVWLRFPKPRWTSGVFVGFQQGRWREYVPKVGESTVAIALRDFSDSQELANRTEDHGLRVWLKLNGNSYEAAVATLAAEVVREPLNVALVRACRLASALTALHHVTRGPFRQLVKEVRRQYRRPRRSMACSNIEFAKEAICVIAVFSQLPQARQLAIAKCANRWRSRAGLASQQFPETMRRVWKRYRELES